MELDVSIFSSDRYVSLTVFGMNTEMKLVSCVFRILQIIIIECAILESVSNLPAFTFVIVINIGACAS